MLMLAPAAKFAVENLVPEAYSTVGQAASALAIRRALASRTTAVARQLKEQIS
jgi:hypothetical protein